MVVAPLPSVELHPFTQIKCLFSVTLQSLSLLRSAQSGLFFVFSALSISRAASCSLHFAGPEHHLYPKYKVCGDRCTNVVSACRLLRIYFTVGVERIIHWEQGLEEEAIDSLALDAVHMLSMWIWMPFVPVFNNTEHHSFFLYLYCI